GGFDRTPVLGAARGVPAVSDAPLRWTAGSGHRRGMGFKAGVDGGQVPRRVVQLLRESMGLPAEPSLADVGLERTGGNRARGTASVGSAGPPMRAHEAPDRPIHPLPPARRSDGSLADIPRAVLDHLQVTTPAPHP